MMGRCLVGNGSGMNVCLICELSKKIGGGYQEAVSRCFPVMFVQNKQEREREMAV